MLCRHASSDCDCVCRERKSYVKSVESLTGAISAHERRSDDPAAARVQVVPTSVTFSHVKQSPRSTFRNESANKFKRLLEEVLDAQLVRQ